MMSPTTKYTVLCSITYLLIFVSASADDESYNLRILHNNDFHSRFAPISDDGSPSDQDKRTDCIGGVARTVHLVEKFKSDADKNVLFLNAGDFYQGNIWYTFYKHKIISDFVPKMHLDALSLGNHEFDDGVDGLYPFLNVAAEKGLPVLASNVDTSKEPKLSNLKKSVILTRKGRKIAVIGYVTPETATLAKHAPTIKFKDEIESIRNEIERIKNQEPDANIFIALGHSGYARDKEIAAAIPDIDIIVGGHTNTFLYDGQTPTDDKVIGPYPTVISHESSDKKKKTLITQAFAYGKYLGLMDVTFDLDGDVISWSGNPIFINSNVPEKTDADLKTLVNEYKRSIDGKFSEVIGQSFVDLEGHCVKCRTGECSMGNLITDAYVDGFVKISRSSFKSGWSKYPIAVTSSGDIRCSKKMVQNEENVTLNDILSIIPFGNTIEVVTMSGRRLKEMFEHSVSTYDPKHERLDGRFLQVSGIHVVYDANRGVGDRVVSLKARCGRDCRTPEYRDVMFDDENATYSVIATNYLIAGGDGYDMVTKDDVKHEPFGTLDYDLLSEYIKSKSPIIAGNDERISFVVRTSSASSLNMKISYLLFTVSIILCLYALICEMCFN